MITFTAIVNDKNLSQTHVEKNNLSYMTYRATFV